MSLQFTKAEFVECPTCRAKSGTPALCRECLERRELHGVVTQIRNRFPANALVADLVKICSHCNGTPNWNCPAHGR